MGKNMIWKYEIGQRLIDYNEDGSIKKDMTIVDKKIQAISRRNRKDENLKYYKYKCNICGFNCGEHWDIKNKKYKDEYWIREGNLNNNGCLCCCNNVILVLGINTIWDTDPWMIPYIGEEIAKTHTHGSHHKVEVICPDCKRKRICKISNIYKAHSMGCSCSDGKSYPEKFMVSMLEELKVDFKTEKIFNWCKFKLNDKLKQGRYDFYFKLNNKQYIIEMDGGFHEKDNEISGQTKEESQLIDKEKDKLANEHGIEVIRIDCNYSYVEKRFEYIKQNILDDEKLNELFDLNKINWNKCNEFALSNLVKMACEIKNNNPKLTTTEIGKLMRGYNKSTICRWLKQGNGIWCNYDTKEEILKNNKKNGERNKELCKKPVEVFKNGISLGVFSSRQEIENNSKQLFGIELKKQSISLVCKGKCKQYLGFTFTYTN